jgi:LPS-assembly protein
LRTERQTGLLFPKIGNSTDDGFRFQLPFFWAISKSTDATIAADYESRSRVGVLGEVRTKFDRDSDLQLHAVYFNESLRQNEKEDIVDRTIADQDIPVDRWSIHGTHRYLMKTGWLTYSDIAAYSDDLFTRELIERFDITDARETDLRRSRYGASSFGAFRGWSDTFFKTQWKFYQDFIQYDQNTLQRTPQIAFWGRRFFAGFPLEFRWQAEAVNYMRREGGDGLRFDLRPEVALPFRAGSYLFGSLSVAPRETFYHLYTTVKSSDHNPSRELVEMRANVGTSLSRIFTPTAFGAATIKHVIEPELTYLFVPRTDQSRIPIMDATDRINRRNVITFALTNRFSGKSPRLFEAPAGEKDIEILNPTASGASRDLGSLKFALSYDIDEERKGGDSLSDLDITLRTSPLSYLTLALTTGVNPGAWQMTQTRASLSLSDPRPITRRALDPDFNRPNSAAIYYYFFRRGPNGFLAEDANIDLDAPANCAVHPDDPRCPTAFNENVASTLGGNLFYRLTDHLLVTFRASYDIANHRFPGFRTAVKVLSGCECWSATLSLKKDINPAKTSFNFDFNLLGLGTQKSSVR